MRHTLRWLLSAALLLGSASAVGTPAAAAPANAVPDIKGRLLALPGVTSAREVTSMEDFDLRAYEIEFTQFKDHRAPSAGTFSQRVTVRHYSDQHPTTLLTLTPHQYQGFKPYAIGFLTNDVAVEQRFTGTSQPSPKDLTKLDVWQVATDLHRVTNALKGLYTGRWLSAGAGETGQVATYHRRFYPADVHGTFVQGGRNDVDNAEDSAYGEAIERISTPACTDRIKDFQREALVRRDELLELYKEEARRNGDSHQVIGSADKAFEISVTNYMWRFWNTFNDQRMCVIVPLKTATTAELWRGLQHGGVFYEGDKQLRWDEVKHYLAGTQTGWPTIDTSHLDDLLRYPGINEPRSLVDRSAPMTFDGRAMADIDRWVREDSSDIVFLYGRDHPSSAERFDTGERDTGAKVYLSPNGGVDKLTPAEQQELTATLKGWAGLV
ncbi:aminopeptidase [Streptomyces sp. JNUCC 64]